jgi:hypothetical protein
MSDHENTRSTSGNGPSDEGQQSAWSIDYASFLHDALNTQGRELHAFLAEELGYAWRDAYLEMVPRATNVVRFQFGTFEYIYDDYSTLEETGVVARNPTIEARLVAVSGRSVMQTGIATTIA